MGLLHMHTEQHDDILRRLADDGPATMDRLAEATGLTLGALNAILCDLLLGGAIRPVAARENRKKVVHYELRKRGTDAAR